MPIEQRIVKDDILRRAVDKLIYSFVTLTVQRREEEYEYAQYAAADGKFVVWVGQLLELPFYGSCNMGKVLRYKTAYNAEQYDIRNTRKVKCVFHVEFEHGISSHEEV